MVCDAVASDLAAGQPPLLSLDRAAAEWPDFAPVAVAGRMGADVPTALRELATRPGAGQLRTLAATWQVAHDTGSGLADAIGQAAAGIRADRRTARLVAAELAAAYATARMLAVLPLGVLLLGSGIGGDPVGFLTGSTAGLVCLALGIAPVVRRAAVAGSDRRPGAPEVSAVVAALAGVTVLLLMPRRAGHPG